MCFAPQRRALFRHRNFQKWSDAEVFCTFWLRNVLRATTACKFFITHLASWLRTRRFSEPTFRPSGATNHWKNTVFRDFPTFSRICIFFLTLSLLLFFLLIFLFSLPLPCSAFHLSILSEVWLHFLRLYYSVVSMFHIMLKQRQRAGEPNGIWSSFFSSEAQVWQGSISSLCMEYLVKWPQPAPLWHVVPWPMPIHEQVQNVRSECLLWHHLLHPFRVAVRLAGCVCICYACCSTTLPARPGWRRTRWSEMTAWSAGPETPLMNNLPKVFRSNHFWGIWGKNQQKWSKIYVGQSKSLSAGGETSKHRI